MIILVTYNGNQEKSNIKEFLWVIDHNNKLCVFECTIVNLNLQMVIEIGSFTKDKKERKKKRKEIKISLSLAIPIPISTMYNKRCNMLL